MVKRLAFVLVLAFPLAADDVTMTFPEISKIAKQIYVCGMIEGTKKFAPVSSIKQLDDLRADAGCALVDELLSKLDELAKGK